jgi:hypothetical protein
MGYYTGTKVSCTNPEILASGSTFNQEWSNSIINHEGGVVEYICRKEYLNEALRELSKKYPGDTFSGVTWIDDDYENAKDIYFILKDGSFEYINMLPHYQILLPVIEDDEYKMLAKRFIEHIYRYLKRIDIVVADQDEGLIFDSLNDKNDNNGFKSYYTIIWENDEHFFKATKRYASQVIVEYRTKNPKKDD